jgi:hypothetical protein
VHRSLIAVLLLSLALSWLAGCEPWKSREERINEAVPLAAPARRTVEALRALSAANPQQAARIQNEVAFRLKFRARSCTYGYSPTFLSSRDNIRNSLQDTGCFKMADAELAEGLGMLWVGLALAQPPLRPLPEGIQAPLGADSSVSNVRFALDAGVAALDLQAGLQVVDMDAGQPLRLVPRKGGHGNDGALSPNGRLLAVEGPDSTRIVETASGEEVLALPGMSARSFIWLDARTAYAASPAGDHGWLLDFQQGHQFPLDRPKGAAAVRALKAPDAEDQYVLFTSRSVARVQVVRFGPEAGVRRLKEREIGEVAYEPALAGVTADGKTAFSALGALSFTVLKTLETTRLELEPFVPNQAVATPDPDQIILTGAMAFEPDRQQQYLLRISSRKLARIESGKPAATRYVYIPSLRRLGLLADRKLTLVHSLPVGPEQPLAKWLAQAVTDAGQVKLEAALRSR